MPERSDDKLDVRKLEKWADSFKAVGHPIRLAIVFMLYGSDQIPGHQSLTFTQIVKILGLPIEKQGQSSLLYHLDKLIDAGFITRDSQQLEPGKSHPQAIYHITERGQEFLRDFNLTEVIAARLTKQKIL